MANDLSNGGAGVGVKAGPVDRGLAAGRGAGGGPSTIGVPARARPQAGQLFNPANPGSTRLSTCARTYLSVRPSTPHPLPYPSSAAMAGTHRCGGDVVVTSALVSGWCILCSCLRCRPKEVFLSCVSVSVPVSWCAYVCALCTCLFSECACVRSSFCTGFGIGVVWGR